MDPFIMQEAFDAEGFCFSKEGKLKNLVLGALPSEEVRAHFVGKKNKERFYILDEVVVAHKERVESVCAEVPRCGGCVFQHFSYRAQLDLKASKIKALFAEDTDKILPIIPSPQFFNYRAKMDFSFSQNKAGEKFLGLTQAKGNGRVMQTAHCHLAPLWMSSVLRCMQEAFKASHLWAYDRRGCGDLRSLILREGYNTGEKMAILEVIAHEKSCLKKTDVAHFFSLIKEVLKEDISCYLRIVQMIPKVPTQFYEMHQGGPLHIHEKLVISGKELIFKISPSAFFQPNPLAAALLFNTMASFAKKLEPKRVLDLFCGTGTLSLCVAPFVETCIGVELNPYAVFDAKENALLNGMDHLQFVQQDAGAYIASIQEPFDLVMVDPPRAGLGIKAAKFLAGLEVPYILYVSCNPITQSQDVAYLKQTGYLIETIQPLDQFPHTAHCENIILLRHKSSLASIFCLM